MKKILAILILSSAFAIASQQEKNDKLKKSCSKLAEKIQWRIWATPDVVKLPYHKPTHDHFVFDYEPYPSGEKESIPCASKYSLYNNTRIHYKFFQLQRLQKSFAKCVSLDLDPYDRNRELNEELNKFSKCISQGRDYTKKDQVKAYDVAY